VNEKSVQEVSTVRSLETKEASLAHAIKDKTEAAYNRTSMVEQRREVMERWAALAYAIVNFTT
jgi:hypothetical protein